MLGQLIRALADATDGIVPRWVWPVGIVIAFVLAWPSIRRKSRTDVALKTFRTATRHGYEERLRREDEAVQMLADHPDGLYSLAQLALAEGRPRVVEGIVARLRASGRLPEQVARLVKATEAPLPGSALEAVILVERFWEQGQHDEARRRLARAQARWPADEDLSALAARISALP